VLDASARNQQSLDRFPNSKYLKQAREHRREVLRRLIDHEVFVARFYLDRGHPKGAILRIKEAFAPLSGLGAGRRVAAHRLGETQLEMGQPATAKQTFLRVTLDIARSVEVKRAELFLDSSSAVTATSPRMTRPMDDRLPETSFN